MIKIDFQPPVSQLRQFGWIALFGFALMAVMVLWQFTDWQANWVVYTLLTLAAVCPLLAVTAPVALKPIYLTLMVIALPIGFVVSAVVMRLIYYGLFTPLALWFRLKGRDAMNRKLNPELTTYWTDHRDQHNPRTPNSYLRLY